MIIYGALHAAGCYALRWSRVLRPLLLVNVTEGRQVGRAATPPPRRRRRPTKPAPLTALRLRQAAQGLPKHPQRPPADLHRLPALHLQHPHLLADGAQTLQQAVGSNVTFDLLRRAACAATNAASAAQGPEDVGRVAVLLQLRRRGVRPLRAGHHGQQP